jgi:hypothetical protein
VEEVDKVVVGDQLFGFVCRVALVLLETPRAFRDVLVYQLVADA